jgi:phage terminase large subunit-like protein
MSNPKLEKQLEQKRKLIQKHKKEYIALLRKYRGFLSKHDEILLHF